VGSRGGVDGFGFGFVKLVFTNKYAHCFVLVASFLPPFLRKDK